MIKESIHTFAGMHRDNHPIRQDKKFLWEAINVRFNSIDGETTLSITNEKGPIEIYNSKNDEYNKYLNRRTLGHCIVGDYLVIFHLDSDGRTVINRYEIDERNNVKRVCLAALKLNMDKCEHFQCIPYYETPSIQKVYWVDGENQLRVINVVDSEFNYKNPKKYDIFKELSLNEEILIENTTGGRFPAGVVQYAFSYVSENGAESAIFYISGLYYSVLDDRAGAEGEETNTAFNIIIKNIDNNQDYICVYRILRTSYNGKAECRLVKRLKIKDSISENTIGIVDKYTIDEQEIDLDYITQKTAQQAFIPKTLCDKDNTLFLGNIEYINKDISSVSDSINRINIYEGYSREVSKDAMFSMKFGDTSYMRKENIYSIGFRLQDKFGLWTNVFGIRNFEIRQGEHEIDGDKLKLPILKYNINQNDINTLKEYGFIKIMPVWGNTEQIDQNILDEGIISQAVYNKKLRDDNLKYAHADWFYRPLVYPFGKAHNEDYTTDGIHPLDFKSISKNNTGASSWLSNINVSRDYDIEFQIPNLVFKFNSYFRIENTSPNDVEFRNDFYYIDPYLLTFYSPCTEKYTKNSIKDIKLISSLDRVKSNTYISINLDTPLIGSEYNIKKEIELTKSFYDDFSGSDGGISFNIGNTKIPELNSFAKSENKTNYSLDEKKASPFIFEDYSVYAKSDKGNLVPTVNIHEYPLYRNDASSQYTNNDYIEEIRIPGPVEYNNNKIYYKWFTTKPGKFRIYLWPFSFQSFTNNCRRHAFRISCFFECRF